MNLNVFSSHGGIPKLYSEEVPKTLATATCLLVSYWLTFTILSACMTVD